MKLYNQINYIKINFKLELAFIIISIIIIYR